MKTLLALFLLISVLQAGDLARVPQSAFIFLPGLNIDAYYSSGFSNMFVSSVPDIASGNPASLSAFDKISLGVRLDYSSKINNALLSSIDFEKGSQFFPGAFAIIVPMNNFNLAASFHQKYSSYINMGKIPFTTEQDPDGASGQFFEPIMESKINSFSGMIATSVSGLFIPDDRLSFGVQVFFDTYSSSEKISRAEASLTESEINWKIGAVYHFNENLQAAILYEKALDITSKLKISGSSFTGNVGTGETGDFVDVGDSQLKVQLPDKLAFGAQIKTGQSLSLSTTLAYVFWESVLENYENQLDFSASAVYSIADFADISAGIYLSDRKNKERYISTNNDATFFSAGIRFSIADLETQLVVLDSHLSSDKSREQTIVNLGFSYSFH